MHNSIREINVSVNPWDFILWPQYRKFPKQNNRTHYHYLHQLHFFQQITLPKWEPLQVTQFSLSCNLLSTHDLMF
jgi:hypothetical protein